jgi:hypothetical protein
MAAEDDTAHWGSPVHPSLVHVDEEHDVVAEHADAVAEGGGGNERGAGEERRGQGAIMDHRVGIVTTKAKRSSMMVFRNL